MIKIRSNNSHQFQSKFYWSEVYDSDESKGERCDCRMEWSDSTAADQEMESCYRFISYHIHT